MVNLKIVRSVDLWYTIGLIASDGNLSKDGRHICITSKDKEFLISIKTALHLNSKLGMKARSSKQEKMYSVLQFSDIALYKFLVSIGISPNKSLSMKTIDVPDDYFKDFLRGIIDGDGNINVWVHKTNRHMQWCLRITSGSPIFASWIHKKIQDHYCVTGKIYSYKFKEKKNPIYIIKFGKVAAKIILQNIYYQNCLSLERKFTKAQKCLRSKNGWKKYGKMTSTARVL